MQLVGRDADPSWVVSGEIIVNAVVVILLQIPLSNGAKTVQEGVASYSRETWLLAAGMSTIGAGFLFSGVMGSCCHSAAG
ncbi:hypothetical protein SAMN05421595_0711 [Austwickia chelonae]|uniref:Uncharacterized protein n=1 Tax=Austwickia chelonae NBRC 105200 TaxID=1184607 RepID=K6V7J1_9MICO|nr:hypothetical protein AUCHE_08_04380 [Austwickia chelonae NBRC 105200]SEV98492.1 hypothetical protein SAMN05421595_0711 [Austwickia chelonae]